MMILRMWGGCDLRLYFLRVTFLFFFRSFLPFRRIWSGTRRPTEFGEFSVEKFCFFFGAQSENEHKWTEPQKLFQIYFPMFDSFNVSQWTNDVIPTELK